MDHTQILLRPVVTEKATFLRDGANQVAFFVHPDANKIEIKKAVETAFNVKVTDVNVVTRKPTERVRNRKVSRVPGWRKAYVTLASGEKIEFFEGRFPTLRKSPEPRLRNPLRKVSPKRLVVTTMVVSPAAVAAVA